MKLPIAIFDFDGTITRKNTFGDFILCSCGFWQLCRGGIKSLPILALLILKVTTNDIAKEKIFSYFFKGVPSAKFDGLRKKYSLNRLPAIIKERALKKIDWHKTQGHELVIVSASMANWIKPWAQNNGFKKIIATELEEKDGVLTGRFKTKNCNKEEKVRRFLEEYPNRQNYYLYVYGDSRNDEPILNIADERFYRKL